MRFVKTDDLKIGMRLAKPIYNNKGVLLYDRNSKLTIQGIESVRNFNLIGIYILEPAEPLPPLSDEDIEFEKFQMVSTFKVKEELDSIRKNGKNVALHQFVESIIRSYGHLDHKINFVQNLRSESDFVYKHSLNVAILSALISNKLVMFNKDQTETIISALTHDIGKLDVAGDLLVNPEITEEESVELERAEAHGHAYIEDAFSASPNIKRAVVQCFQCLEAFKKGAVQPNIKVVDNAKVLMVAEIFDTMTAINAEGEPQSEVAVVRLLQKHPEIFDPKVVKALVDSINLLSEGCSVELSNGEKALVIASNPNNVLRPTVLCFSTNTIIDLSQTAFYSDIEVVDVMKSLDTRYDMRDN